MAPKNNEYLYFFLQVFFFKKLDFFFHRELFFLCSFVLTGPQMAQQMNFDLHLPDHLVDECNFDMMVDKSPQFVTETKPIDKVGYHHQNLVQSIHHQSREHIFKPLTFTEQKQLPTNIRPPSPASLVDDIKKNNTACRYNSENEECLKFLTNSSTTGTWGT